MAQKSAPRYQAPLAQHLMFAFYAVAFYALVFTGIYLGLERWCQESTRKNIADSVNMQLLNVKGKRPADWVKTINVTRVSDGEYRVQASLVPPAGDPNLGNLAPVTLDYPVSRNSYGGRLQYSVIAENYSSSGNLAEETISNMITPLMKRYGIMLIPLFLFGLFWLIVWIKFFNKAGYPSYYVLVPGVNLFYVYTMMTDGLPKAWLMFLGSSIPGINAIVWIIGSLGLARNFGKSGGFAVGLMFMPMIFIAILAFGKSKYQPEGPTEEY